MTFGGAKISLAKPREGLEGRGPPDNAGDGGTHEKSACDCFL